MQERRDTGLTTKATRHGDDKYYLVNMFALRHAQLLLEIFPHTPPTLSMHAVYEVAAPRAARLASKVGKKKRELLQKRTKRAEMDMAE